MPADILPMRPPEPETTAFEPEPRRVRAAVGMVAFVLRGIAVALCLLVALGVGRAVAVGADAWPTASRTDASAASRAASSPPAALDTAVFDPNQFGGPDAKLAFAHARQAGTTVVRLILGWAQVAPAPLPAGSDPASPTNPGYRWDAVDQQVKLALQAGLQPILCVLDPPAWARAPDATGSRALSELRDTADLGRFMLAAARRYSGTFQGLPRVRYWQAWNEPNVSDYLDPQYSRGQPASPDIYRQLVNAVADAVHSVRRDNLVVAGGSSPFAQGDATTDPKENHVVIGPMRFMRALLCMSEGSTPKPTCNDQIRFDVWSHHPYTSGGPGHHASTAGDASLGDLPEMKAVLDAAVKAGHVRSTNGVRFWVTEFSWDSNPPDPKGVPATLEAQWISEAMYEMWKTGISLVTWFLLRDAGHFQSGLYDAGPTVAADKARPTLVALRFPFVGHIVKGKISVWGRTPWGKPGRVLVEERTKQGWKPLGTVKTNRFGIFVQTFGPPRGEYVRARVLGKGGLGSRSFPLAGPKDMAVKPFGS